MKTMNLKLVEKIKVPHGVTVEIKGTDVKVTGGTVTNSRHFRSGDIELRAGASAIEVYAKSTKRDILAETKSIASHINNMVIGTQKTFEARLEIVYSHFPINVAVKGTNVEISNLTGQKSPKKAKIIGESQIEVKGKEILVKGHNKEAVAQTAANMEQATRARGKDIRIFADGIYITQKVKAV